MKIEMSVTQAVSSFQRSVPGPALFNICINNLDKYLLLRLTDYTKISGVLNKEEAWMLLEKNYLQG